LLAPLGLRLGESEFRVEEPRINIFWAIRGNGPAPGTAFIAPQAILLMLVKLLCICPFLAIQVWQDVDEIAEIAASAAVEMVAWVIC
jgi:hypothetical protein